MSNYCLYNFATCSHGDCENWDETWGCGLFRGIKSLSELEDRLEEFSEVEVRTSEDQRKT